MMKRIFCLYRNLIRSKRGEHKLQGALNYLAITRLPKLAMASVVENYCVVESELQALNLLWRLKNEVIDDSEKLIDRFQWRKDVD